MITEYNEEYGDNIRASSFISKIVATGILTNDSSNKGSIFANRSQLAYFVAREINSRYQSTQDKSDLEYILRYSCFGINADILLFISYITDNTRVLQLILEMAKELTSEWEEFDFCENLPGFFKNGHNHEDELPSSNTAKNEERAIVANEREVDSRLQTIEIYDYDESEAETLINQIIRALSLLSVISRCLPGFEHNMTSEMKNEFVW